MTHIIGTPSKEGEQPLISNVEVLKLTPVNFKCLPSPIEEYTQSQEAKNEFNTIANSSNIYNENFHLISKQLEKLLENLNVIYGKIGYSNSEIIKKEKIIFSTLSDSITNYFEQADEDLNQLSIDNQVEQGILNKVLELINDPSGTETIPDLYIRNSILEPKSKTVPLSPKKEITLLSKQKLLISARKYVFTAYIPKLTIFLTNCMELQKLTTLINENDNVPFLADGNDQIISNIPSLETSKSILEKMSNDKEDIEAVSSFIKENKDVLLYDNKLLDISNERSEIIVKLTSKFQDEYNLRISLLSSINNKIIELLNELEVDINDLGPEIINSIKLYSTTNKLNTSNTIPVYSSIVERLKKVYEDYKLIHFNRSQKKHQLLQKCEMLWSKLKVPKHQTDNFLTQNSGLSIQNIINLEDEFERLENMKKKLIKTLISESLQRIEEIWVILDYTDNEKFGFQQSFDLLMKEATTLEDDERILEFSERELKSLEKKLSIYTPVLKLYDEFKALQKDSISLENSSKDSSRLLLRNSHKILLQEEKTRKKITRYFPRVIQELRNKLDEMEELFKKPFLVRNVKLVDIISRQEEQLLSKYPRIRLNGSIKKKQSPSVKKLVKIGNNKSPASRVTKKSIAPGTVSKPDISNFIEQSFVHKTPIRTVPASNMDTSTILSKSDQISNYNRYMHSTRISSPPKPVTKLLPPTIITRREPSNILETNNVNENFNPISNNNIPLKAKNGYIRPTRLFPVSVNSLNKGVSQIPVLIKDAKEAVRNLNVHQFEKENRQELNFNMKKLMISKAPFLNTNWSSPYKEPDNSIYKISMSPEGKCQLNIQDAADSGIDDTSIMDDDNDKMFISWKKEQLSKMNGFSKTNILQEGSINWKTDVL